VAFVCTGVRESVACLCEGRAWSLESPRWRCMCAVVRAASVLGVVVVVLFLRRHRRDGYRAFGAVRQLFSTLEKSVLDTRYRIGVALKNHATKT
jgi:hypothetical protein